MVHKSWISIEEMFYCFPRSSVKFQADAGQKNHRFSPNFSVSGLLLQFEFTDGYEMMHKT